MQHAARNPFVKGELFAGSLGCGNNLIEALIAAQIIPAGIEAEIAVCRHSIFDSGNRRDNLELLERAVALAVPGLHACLSDSANAESLSGASSQ